MSNETHEFKCPHNAIFRDFKVNIRIDNNGNDPFTKFQIKGWGADDFKFTPFDIRKQRKFEPSIKQAAIDSFNKQGFKQ